MAEGLAFWLLWVVVAALAGALTFAAWYGPNQDISNLSRWAWLLGWRRVPRWFQQRAIDRWTMLGGPAVGVLLLMAAGVWVWTPAPTVPVTPAPAVPDTASLSPEPPPPGTPQPSTRPPRQLDAEMENAILLHVPKDKQIRLLVLAGDLERSQFADQIDAFLRASGYTAILPRRQFVMGGEPPVGTTVYADEKEPNVINIRVGVNDR